MTQCWVPNATPQKEPGSSKIIPLTDHTWLGIRKRPRTECQSAIKIVAQVLEFTVLSCVARHLVNRLRSQVFNRLTLLDWSENRIYGNVNLNNLNNLKDILKKIDKHLLRLWGWSIIDLKVVYVSKLPPKINLHSIWTSRSKLVAY